MIILVWFIFLDLSIAYFHAFTVKTTRFCKTAYNKIHLSLQALASEVKPCGGSVWIHLLVHFYYVTILPLILGNFPQTAALKITLEDRIANFNYFAFIGVHTALFELAILAGGLIFLDGFEGLYDIESEFFLNFLFWPEGVGEELRLDVCSKRIGKQFIVMGLELISALLSVHYFI